MASIDPSIFVQHRGSPTLLVSSHPFFGSPLFSAVLSSHPPSHQRRIGYRRLVGRGVVRDEAGAYRAFQVAAEAGDAMALYNLG